MKATTVCASVLSTLILGGMVVSAAESPSTPNESLTTHGHVEVKTGNIDPEGGLIDPEKPDETIPEGEIPDVKPNPNPNMGPLEITHAPELQFGEVKTSNNDVTKHAEANEYGDETRGAILQFGDLRTEAYGYTVTATMTQQFIQDTNELKGATITFTNPHAATKEGATGARPTIEDSFELVKGEAATVATADKANLKEGKGMWVVEYGSSANVGEGGDTTGESVQLTIPANTASSMAGGTYVSDIEWSITAAP